MPPGRFVAVADTGVNNRVMTSPDGINWSIGVTAGATGWRAVCYAPELRLLVAVGSSGAGNFAMTSIDGGITWINRVTANATMQSVAWSPTLGLFAAVGESLIYTSPDGIVWTNRANPMNPANLLRGVAWCPGFGKFVAVANDAVTFNCMLESSDGILWTLRSGAAVAGVGFWEGVAYSPALNRASAVGGIQPERVNYTNDGTVWQNGTFPAAAHSWEAVCWSPQLLLFVAVAGTAGAVANRAMTSINGVNYTQMPTPDLNQWRGIAWSPELGVFAAVSSSGVGNRAMTSADGGNWTSRASAADNDWYGITWVPGTGRRRKHRGGELWGIIPEVANYLG
jgi:hypothetical protein